MRVEIDLPEEIVAFLKDVAKLSDLDLEAYLRDCAIRSFMGDLETIGDCVFWDSDTIKLRYALQKFDPQETKEDP